jgi:hypothetical protein
MVEFNNLGTKMVISFCTWLVMNPPILSINKSNEMISSLPPHLYQSHLYQGHLFQTSYFPSSKNGRTHKAKLAGAIINVFCLWQKMFRPSSIVPGLVVDSRFGTDELWYS